LPIKVYSNIHRYREGIFPGINEKTKKQRMREVNEENGCIIGSLVYNNDKSNDRKQ
jgi:hypothetical protein